MRPTSFAAQLLFSAAFTAGIVACTDAPEQANEAQAADVDVLPADESSATPSGDLENGALEAPAEDNAALDANAQ